MKHGFYILLASAILVPNLGCASNKPTSASALPSQAHYVERTCTFGKFGVVTVHEGGTKDTYIVVHGKRFLASGGENFVQSNEDDSVAVMFDRKGTLLYQGEVPGRNCRTTRR